MYGVGRIFMFRIPRGNELLDYINRFAQVNNISMAWINAIGSIEDVELAYYDRTIGEYLVKKYPGVYELVVGTGNISLRDNKPFTHMHVVIGDQENKAYAGHLVKAQVYVAEIVIVEFTGEPKLVREHVGGKLWLWPIRELVNTSSTKTS